MFKEVPVHDLKVNTKLSCVRKRCGVLKINRFGNISEYLLHKQKENAFLFDAIKKRFLKS